jgi:hypothetical protein
VGRPREAAAQFQLAIASGGQGSARADPNEGLAAALLAMGDLAGAHVHIERAITFAEAAGVIILREVALAAIDAADGARSGVHQQSTVDRVSFRVGSACPGGTTTPLLSSDPDDMTRARWNRSNGL